MKTESVKRLYDELDAYQTMKQTQEKVNDKLYRLYERLNANEEIQKTSLIQEIVLLENEKRRICINMEYIQNLIHSRVLKKTEREMLNDRFIEGMKYDELSIKYGYGQRYIYDIVEAIIEKLHAYLVKNKLIVETI
ncbi:MAG: hypothetical protein HFF02_01170 [Erysipelotrichaceae bacterium]|nr:hypothetical protein [Erysipelotrichaceae bacterium]